MSNSVFVPAVLDSGGSTFKDNCVKSNKRIDAYYQRQNVDPRVPAWYSWVYILSLIICVYTFITFHAIIFESRTP